MILEDKKVRGYPKNLGIGFTLRRNLLTLQAMFRKRDVLAAVASASVLLPGSLPAEEQVIASSPPGFELVDVKREPLRKEAGNWIEGEYFLFRYGGEPATSQSAAP